MIVEEQLLKKTPKSLPTASRRRIRKRVGARPPWIDKISPYATLLLAIGVFATAVGQWRAADRQAATAEALRRLEYARSSARFAFDSAGSIPLGPSSNPRLIEVPNEIGVRPTGGVDAVLGLDSEVLLVLSEAGSDGICRTFVRGLYEYKDEGLVLSAGSRSDFNALIVQLAGRGIEVRVPSYNVSITYTDVFGALRRTHYQVEPSSALEIDETRPTSLILYSRRWTLGSGYYFDEPGTPMQNCPSVAKKLEAAITAAGGRPPSPADVDRALNEMIKRDGLEVPGVTN